VTKTHSEEVTVTIAIPNYNTSTYIGEAIQSAISQTFFNIEILIVDNASTDNSRDIIKFWAKKDSRIVVHCYDEFVKSMDNWNRCLALARGKYIVFLHADDRLKPRFLEAALEVHDRWPNLGYVLAENEMIDSGGNLLYRQQFYEGSAVIPGLSEARVSLLGWHIVPVQMLIRTECMRDIGGYHVSDVMAPLLLNLKWDVGYLHTPLVQYRLHEQSSTTQCIKDKSLIMAIYLTKMLVLNHWLPPEALYLKELIGPVMEKTGTTCLSLYAMNVLGRNEKRLCQEYMALARGFWLDIDQTPLYRFLEDALKEKEWTPETLQEAWVKVRPPSALSGPPYPLPEGSVVIPISV